MNSPLHHSHSSSEARGSEILHARWARYCNAALGVWLFISAFAWDHAPASRMNTCLVGLFVLVSAVTATGWSMVRRLTMMLALWLVFSTIAAYPDGAASSWNNIIVALVVFGLAAIPGEMEQRNLP